MPPGGIHNFVHAYAPHSAEALYAAAICAAAIGCLLVLGRCWATKSTKRLDPNWFVTVIAVAAPVPTWCLLVVIPFDHDLAGTVANDPVVVALAGAYGISAAFRDLRRLASEALKKAGGTSNE